MLLPVGVGRNYERFTAVGKTVLERLNSKLVQCGECWEFLGGYVDRRGYGKIGVGDKVHLAHRVAYTEMVGPIPEGLDLDHLCRNPPCCNPDHLEPVPHRVNVQRGRAGYAPGDRCKHGHDLSDPANVYVHTKGKPGRKCRPCAIKNAKEAHARWQSARAQRAANQEKENP